MIRSKFSPLILTLITFAVFHAPLEWLINATVVPFVFSKIKTSWLTDVALILVAVLSLMFTVKRLFKYHPSIRITQWLTSLSVIYCYYRLNGQPWTYVSFKFASEIFYLDIILWITFCQGLLFIKKKRKLTTEQVTFLYDEPTDLDTLGYERYATSIASKIGNHSPKNSSFALGINGQWGLGKSSFLKILRKKLPPEAIVIEFNPWARSGSESIIQGFFETLQETLSKYHSGIARSIMQYAEKLLYLNDGSLSKTVFISASLITGNSSANTLHEDVNRAIKQINRQVIIIIDDLDRLDKDEIIEVIRLIRNTASFSNTFFIVAYDRVYLNEALRSHNAYKNVKYLEKIFQLEISLPYFKKKILRDKFNENLQNILPERYRQLAAESDGIGLMIAKDYFADWIDNLRDVTRLSNQIALNISDILGEIDLKDFIKIELLRMKYPSVYMLLYRNAGTIFDSTKHNYHYADSTWALATVKTPSSSNKTLNESGTYIEQYLRENATDINVSETDIPDIIGFLKSIFPPSPHYGDSKLSIKYGHNFYKYFTYSLLEGSISQHEFAEALTLPIDELKEKISYWTNNGMRQDLYRKFFDFDKFTSREEFEKIILAIFYFASQHSDDNLYYNIVGYDQRNLRDKISDYHHRLSKDFYGGNKDSLKKFILSLFENASPPFRFESDFIRFLNADLGISDHFPLSKEELTKIAVEYLNTYIKASTTTSRDLYYLLWQTETTDWIPVGGNSYTQSKKLPEEAKKHFIEFVTVNCFDDFLLGIIRQEHFGKKLFAVIEEMPSIFDTWENFKSVVFAQDEKKWLYLSEFKVFFSAFEQKNFAQFVPFQFTIIPVTVREEN
jgi:hypothetical protein